ncbi:MAG: tryptophan synthase subunit alpha [Chloroflexi bacterium]|nr:tryptophan synthase subunit alpha [Chloroflexota bacterium]
MSRIATAFSRPGHKALIAYVTMGYPSIADTLRVLPLLQSAGCDMVELGIPFSDPMADGTTIQEANHVALQNGVTPQKCLELASQVRASVDIPLLFMTYLNPIINYGADRFCHSAAASGIDGFIITDMPPEEAGEVAECARSEGIDLVYLLAPTSTAERVKLVARKASGFIYLVSVTGVTGARKDLPGHLEKFVSSVRKETRQPLCVGFGISSGAVARRVARIADGVVVGSRLVQYMAGSDWKGLEAFVKELRQALDNTEA